MTKKKKEREELRAEYLQLEPTARKFANELEHQLGILVESEKVSLGFPIAARVKSWESMDEKLKRLPHEFHSITEIQDFIGIRLIFLYKRDIEKVCEKLGEVFEVTKQEDTFDRLQQDQFGYTSIHLVIKIPEDWLVVPSLSQFGEFKAEIQLRTVAQHLWAEASHKLQYKSESSVPEPVLRAIFRVSALLETVDLEFDRVLGERDIYRQTLDPKSLVDDLNTDSLEVLLDAILPPKNKYKTDEYGLLLIELNALGIKSPAQLEELLVKNLDKVLAKESKEVVRRAIERDFDEEDDKSRVIEKGVFFTHVGLVRTALDIEFGSDWRSKVSKALRKS